MLRALHNNMESFRWSILDTPKSLWSKKEIHQTKYTKEKHSRLGGIVDNMRGEARDTGNCHSTLISQNGRVGYHTTFMRNILVWKFCLCSNWRKQIVLGQNFGSIESFYCTLFHWTIQKNQWMIKKQTCP